MKDRSACVSRDGLIECRASVRDKRIATVHFKKVILILSGYEDKLHVPADSCIATDYASNDDETSNLILASDETSHS